MIDLKPRVCIVTRYPYVPRPPRNFWNHVRIGPFAALMDEVDADIVHFGFEMRELVE
jgi:hypothetical protein